MAGPGKLDRFDRFLPADPWVNPWQPDGSYRTDLALLETLLGVAVGTSQQSGVVAGAADVWAAEELRRAGFDADEVWPRRSVPRVMPRDVRNFVQLALPKRLHSEVEERFDKPGARRAYKMTAELDVYDCACLLVVEGAQGTQEDGLGRGRSAEEEPPALLPLRETVPDGDDRVAIAELEGSDLAGASGTVSVRRDLVPSDLAPDHFFDVLISRAVERMPVAVYPGVRRRRASAAR